MSDAGTLIVGGGIHGCALAWELARRGRPVTVLEKAVPGAEASSAAGGILGPHLEADGAGPFLELARYSHARYPGWVADLEAASGVPVAFHACGGLIAVIHPGALDRRREQAARLVELGLPAEWMDGPELLRREPNLGRVLGGIWLPQEAQVDPRALMTALPVAARRAGARFERDTVYGIEALDGGVRVRCASGVRDVGQLVLAAGAWSSTLPGAGLPAGTIQPARGQMLLLELPERPLGPIVFSERGYLVPRRDGRVLTGSTLEFEGFAKAVTARGVRNILDLAIEICPTLENATVVDAWSGLRPFTADELPVLGEGPVPGVWWSTGHYRNGILMAPGTAALMADLLTGARPEVDPTPFSATRFAEP